MRVTQINAPSYRGKDPVEVLEGDHIDCGGFMLCILLMWNNTCPLLSLYHAVCKNDFIGPIEVTLEKKDCP